MSVTREHQLECGCGATLDVILCDSLNAQRHPHLRERLLERELHVFRCDACDEEIFVENKMTYIDLERKQFYAVAPDTERKHERVLGESLLDAWTIALGDGAPRSVQALFGASKFNVRMCFGFEELREKIVANDAGLDDLALEVFKAELMATHQEWANAGVRTLRLDHVEEDGRFAFFFERDTDPTSLLELGYLISPERYQELAAKATADLLAQLPQVAAGPHVSLLRVLEELPVAGA